MNVRIRNRVKSGGRRKEEISIQPPQAHSSLLMRTERGGFTGRIHIMWYISWDLWHAWHSGIRAKVPLLEKR
jgi:hypothetical protein